MYFEAAKVVVSALTPLSIYVAYKAYKANLDKQKDDRIRDADKELLIQAQKSLECAYNALTDTGKSIPPKASRLNWLTCARHLLRHKKLAERIQSETYKVVHAEHEEFWRHQFYLALDQGDLANERYFTLTNENPWPENIEVTSALVVIAFSNWRTNQKDPTDDIDRGKILADKEALKGFAGRGLRSYIELLDRAHGRAN